MPVVMAALAEDTSKSRRKIAARAITKSDNAAALSLWRVLGTPAQAGKKTQAELRAAGDSNTTIQHHTVRAGFTPFGQTQWSLVDQARFAGGLPCAPHADTALELMGQIDVGQRWGLGHLPSAAFKGGWGPEGDRSYLVRQMGVVQDQDGNLIGIAVATISDRGFAAGTRDLTTLAEWLAGRLRSSRVRLQPPPSDCPKA